MAWYGGVRTAKCSEAETPSIVKIDLSFAFPHTHARGERWGVGGLRCEMWSVQVYRWVTGRRKECFTMQSKPKPWVSQRINTFSTGSKEDAA